MSRKSEIEDFPPHVQRAIERARTGTVPPRVIPAAVPIAKGHFPEQVYRSQLEADYAEHLDALKAAGEIAGWEYEGVTFNLGGGAKYKPDFMVMLPSCEVEFHETKGFWRESHRVRIKVAAGKFRWFRFKGITRLDGAWKEEPF